MCSHTYAKCPLKKQTFKYLMNTCFQFSEYSTDLGIEIKINKFCQQPSLLEFRLTPMCVQLAVFNQSMT